jgi:hypothetical protein
LQNIFYFFTAPSNARMCRDSQQAAANTGESAKASFVTLETC